MSITNRRDGHDGRERNLKLMTGHTILYTAAVNKIKKNDWSG